MCSSQPKEEDTQVRKISSCLPFIQHAQVSVSSTPFPVLGAIVWVVPPHGSWSSYNPQSHPCQQWWETLRCYYSPFIFIPLLNGIANSFLQPIFLYSTFREELLFVWLTVTRARPRHPLQTGSQSGSPSTLPGTQGLKIPPLSHELDFSLFENI